MRIAQAPRVTSHRPAQYRPRQSSHSSSRSSLPSSRSSSLLLASSRSPASLFRLPVSNSKSSPVSLYNPTPRHTSSHESRRWLSTKGPAPSEYLSLVYANSKGEIVEHPYLKLLGRVSPMNVVPVLRADCVPLPAGSEFFFLEKRNPMGWNPRSQGVEEVKEDPYDYEQTTTAVASFVSPAYTHMSLPTYNERSDAPMLPLFSYAPIGVDPKDGKFYVHSIRVDDDNRQDFENFDAAEVKSAVERKTKKHKQNRLIQHLGKCATEYGCACSKNYFLGRWEAPIPTASDCNARCVGCISKQDDIPELVSPQQRIPFTPTAAEIGELAIPHLKNAERAVVSFGQGCEGEPLLQHLLIGTAISDIRKATNRGTININTNGLLPRRLMQLREHGLDSVRVSLNSVRDRYYNNYYRPKGGSELGLSALRKSLKEMKRAGGFTSINYLVMPGLNDEEDELNALMKFVEETGLDLIQWKNLNIDPMYYISQLDWKEGPRPLGIKWMMIQLRQKFPHLKFGYFNPCLDPSHHHQHRLLHRRYPRNRSLLYI